MTQTPSTPQAGNAGTDPQPQAGDPQPTPQAGSGKTPEDYERMIADLRKENAGHRTRLKKFEDDETQRTQARSEEHTSELQSPDHLVCRLLLEKKKKTNNCKRMNTHNPSH